MAHYSSYVDYTFGGHLTRGPWHDNVGFALRVDAKFAIILIDWKKQAHSALVIVPFILGIPKATEFFTVDVYHGITFIIQNFNLSNI